MKMLKISSQSSEKQQHHECGPSALLRRAKCPASLRAERDAELSEMPSCSSEDAEAGTLCHMAVCYYEILQQLTDAQKAAVMTAKEYVSGPGWIHEQSLELIDDDGSIITFGTPDAFRIDDYTNTGYLVDFKFGWIPPVDEDAHYQLGTYAAMIAQAYDVSSVEAIIVAPNCKPVVTSRYTFTDFDAIKNSVRRIITKCNEDPYHYRVGDHCKYCRAKVACHAYEHATAVVQRKPDPIITADNAANWYDLADMVEARAKEIKKMVEAKFDEANGLPGFELKPGRSARSIGDVNAVWRQAAKLGIKPEEFMGIVSINVGDTEKMFVEKYVETGAAKNKAAAKEIFNHEVPIEWKRAASKIARVKS